MKRIRLFINKYFFSDELSFGARILNLICALGAAAAFVAFIALIIAGMSFMSILPAMIIFAALVAVFIIAVKRSKDSTVITAIFLYVLGIVLLPGMFFTGGGARSGISAYIVLIIILDFLLLKGKRRIGALVSVAAAAIFCYASTLLFGLKVWPEEGLSDYQFFVDTIQAMFVTGLFLGILITFQNKAYLKERAKTVAVSAEITRSEELLTLVNESAALLLTAETDKFDEALAECMRKIAVCLDMDCIYIWRLSEQNGEAVYALLYEWFKSGAERETSFEAVAGAKSIPRMSDWDDKMFSERGYMSERVEDFGGFVGAKLKASGIKSVMAFPVFFQGKYWGFVTYENRHSERLCSEREAVILQSGSLLLANAVERNENMLMISERLAQQQLMSDISKSFISKEPIGDLIRSALSNMGSFLNVERVLIAVFEKNRDVSRPEYFWFASQRYAPNTSQKGFSSILKELFPRSHDNNDDTLTIYCDNTLTHNGGNFKIFNEKSGLKSFIGVPIYVNSELWGIMSIEKHEGFRRWNENDAQLISTVASAISNAVARDVIEKERAAALQQAIAASSAKGEFLSNMSHEIRTPMNAIIGMTSIGKGAQTLEKKDYAFDKIDNASKHLLGVINDILDMSKIEANKLELSPATFEFEKMVQKVVNFINFRVDERKQHFYVNLDSKIPQTLIGDDQRLSQVITNLLSNAVKFTPEEGTIRLNARLLSEKNNTFKIQVEVIDTGIGITAEQKARLFRSFEQAEAGTSRKFGGTGLGLAISKRIVELMDGKIWVESEHGQGSTFAFTVKLQRGAKIEQRLLGEDVDWSNIRIFAVDDEPDIREFFLETAAELGIFCRVAASGEEAVEHLNRENEYSIYFLDWKLPGMNGLELARHIRTESGGKFVIILFSSCDWSTIEDDARTVGIDKFLPKPLFRSAIIDYINEYINSGKQNEQAEQEDEYDDFSEKTILLAEDVDINREILISLLEPTGIKVDCAENGAQAFEMFEASPDKYDLIFMDVQMPEMDGYEATYRIRAMGTPKSREIPIVAMTANVFREDVERCLDSGMNAHVGKPIDIGEVLVMLRAFLKQ